MRCVSSGLRVTAPPPGHERINQWRSYRVVPVGRGPPCRFSPKSNIPGYFGPKPIRLCSRSNLRKTRSDVRNARPRDGSGSGSGRIPAGFESCGFEFGDGFSPTVFGFGIGFGFGFGFSPVDIQNKSFGIKTHGL
jgi:hypothetical protein